MKRSPTKQAGKQSNKNTGENKKPRFIDDSENMDTNNNLFFTDFKHATNPLEIALTDALHPSLRFQSQYSDLCMLIHHNLKEISTINEPCIGPQGLFEALIFKLKPNIKYAELHYKNPYSDIKRNMNDFANNPDQNKFYIKFVFKTNSTNLHASMLYIEKTDNGVKIFFKNPFGSACMGDFKRNFPSMMKILKSLFKKIEVKSDLQQQQSLESYNCTIITYFNMIDHLQGSHYRVPLVDSYGNESSVVTELRQQLAAQYSKFISLCQEATTLSEQSAAIEMSELFKLRNQQNNASKRNFIDLVDEDAPIGPEPSPKLLEMFEYQRGIFIEQIQKIPFEIFALDLKHLSDVNCFSMNELTSNPTRMNCQFSQ